MNNQTYHKQELIRRIFEADSVAIQIVKGSVYYSIIDGPFSICIDSTPNVTFTIFYQNEKLYTGEKESLVRALNRSKKLLEDFKERAYLNQVQKEIYERNKDKITERELETSN